MFKKIILFRVRFRVRFRVTVILALTGSPMGIGDPTGTPDKIPDGDRAGFEERFAYRFRGRGHHSPDRTRPVAIPIYKPIIVIYDFLRKNFHYIFYSTTYFLHH